MSIYSQIPQHASQKKDIFLYSHNAMITPNKIANNSFLSSISQPILKLPSSLRKMPAAAGLLLLPHCCSLSPEEQVGQETMAQPCLLKIPERPAWHQRWQIHWIRIMLQLQCKILGEGVCWLDQRCKGKKISKQKSQFGCLSRLFENHYKKNSLKGRF